LRRLENESEVRALPVTLTTFGADVGAISFFVFGEEQPSRLARQLREQLLRSEGNWEQLFERYSSEIAPEFLMLLRSDMDSGRNGN
jgi:hypothetical protein